MDLGEGYVAWATLEAVMHGIALLVALLAAYTDHRSGLIPNALTFPALLLAPFAWAIGGGSQGLLESIGGMLFCSLAPALIYTWKGAPTREDGSRDALMKGGDVKLFAALGALFGPFVGIETQFYAMVAASLYGIVRLAWEGALFRALGNSLFIMLNPFLPTRWRREIRSESLHTVRMGPFIFIGALVAALLRHPEWLFGAAS